MIRHITHGLVYTDGEGVTPDPCNRDGHDLCFKITGVGTCVKSRIYRTVIWSCVHTVSPNLGIYSYSLGSTQL